MTNSKDLSFFWANCHYLKPCLSFFRENDLATLILKYRVLQKKGYYFDWSLFVENLNYKLNMRDIGS